MSVSQVDRSNQMQDHQNVKESYEERERNLIQRQRRELANLESKHQEQVKQAKSEYEKQLNDVKYDTQKTITDKDRKHFKEVQDMKDAQRKQLLNLKSDSEAEKQITKSTLEGELKRAKEKNKTDNERLSESYQGQISEMDASRSEATIKSREGSQEALRTQAKRLQDSFDEERKYYQTTIREEKKESDRDKTLLRRSKEQEVNALNRKYAEERKRLEGKYTDILKSERLAHSSNIDEMREGVQDAVQDNRERFLEKQQNLEDQYQDNFGMLTESVSDRQEKEVDSVRRENALLRNANHTEKHTAHVQSEREKRDLVKSMQNNIDELEKRRLEANDMNQKQHALKIDEITNKHNLELLDAHQDHVSKIEEERLRAQNNFDSTIGQVVRDKEMTKVMSDRQKKKLAEYYNETTNAQTEFFDNQMAMKDQNQRAVLDSQRVGLEKMRLTEVNALRDQMANQSAIHQEKLIETVSNYEKAINQMRNEFTKKFKQQNDIQREQNNRALKHLEMDRQATESKFNERLNHIKETYEKEIDQMKKRHAQERQDWATKKS